MDFMILALPRSGTTWLANWLTTDKSLCYHDIVGKMPLEKIAAHRVNRPHWGAACTGLGLFPKWCNAQPARRLIVVRDVEEVNASLTALGLGAISDEAIYLLTQLQGVHVPFDQLWHDEVMREIWRYLLPEVPFDQERYEILKEFSIQPDFDKWAPDPAVVQASMESLRASLHGQAQKETV